MNQRLRGRNIEFSTQECFASLSLFPSGTEGTCVCVRTAFQAEQAGTTMNISVPQVQLINPENQIVEASSIL